MWYKFSVLLIPIQLPYPVHMLHWTPEDSQEPEDDMIETVARKRAEWEYTKWQRRKSLEEARKFRWVGGMC